MIIRATLAAAAILVSVQEARAQQWFCEANSAVGYIYGLAEGATEYDWHYTPFSVDHRYIISVEEDEEDVVNYPEVTRLGESEPVFECNIGVGETIICVRTLSNFTFNTDTMRYVMTYMAGFLDAQDVMIADGVLTNNPNAPRIEIGECAPF